MKNILTKTLIGACLIASASSCSDQFLQDKKDYNNMTTLDVFKDPAQASAVFSTIYKQILEKYNSPVCGADVLMRQGQASGGVQHVLTDEVSSGYLGSNIMGDSRFCAANVKNTKAGNFLANPTYWNDPRDNANNYNNFNRRTLFPTVYLINNYIIEIDRARTLYNNEEFWNNLKGQAIFARAWLYFDAIRLCGGVPYYCTETDSPQAGDRSKRLSIADCVEKICADFEAASFLLPAKWDENNEGRFTSVAALAMISRVRVYAASPIFNASWDNTASKRWQVALEASLAADAAAKAAGHGTSINDIDAWDKSFYSYNNAFNPEAIIKVPKSDLSTATGVTFNVWENYIRPGVVTSGTSAGLPAPDQVLQQFPMKNGKRPTVENGYDDEKFYRNRDPRFYRTFAFSGCQWPGTNSQIWLYTYKFSTSTGNMYRYTDGATGDNGAQKKSRAIVWKMSNPNIAIGGESTGGTDIMEFRYAEILLNIAECYAAQGNSNQCIEYLKKIRQRVGITSADNYGLGSISDKYALIEAVLNERAVEFAYEGKRFWDMRRWLLFEGGAGFDPVFAGLDGNRKYNPELAWGAGWRIYDGKDGRPSYTKASNILTKLGLKPFSGTKHTSKVWGYNMDNVYPIDGVKTENGVSKLQHPLMNNALLAGVSGIKKDMNDSQREAAFEKLEAFYSGVGMKTFDPIAKMGDKYGMDSGSDATSKNFLFTWRGWYYVYSIHYDMYNPAKGNDWIEQTAGWATANIGGNPAGTVEEQDGKYVYCLPEQ